MKKEFVLALLDLKLSSKKTYHKIISYNPNTLESFLDILQEYYPYLKLQDVLLALDNAWNLIDFCHKKYISIFTFDEIPNSLKEIPSPPIVLFVKGNASIILNAPKIAIIGARTTTNYAPKMNRKLVTLFTQMNYCIVSGLALGCDTLAHSECIRNGGRTIAVLPSGCESVYPKSNYVLAQKILETGGALVSEYMPYVTPHKYHFIERDRLQSGISQAVIVLETDIKSGTMHTVRFAIQQGKKVACMLPHSLDYLSKKELEGNLFLIQKGLAHKIVTKKDLIEFMNSIKSNQGLL